MTGTKDDLLILRAMLADAPTEVLVAELERRGYTCVPSEREVLDEDERSLSP